MTRFGKPIAEVVAPSPPAAAKSWMGALRNNASIEGDLVAPATDPSDWEALHK